MFTNCNCGSTGGCPRCMPDNFPSNYNYSNLPESPREGWICPKCKVANAPDNEICKSCTPNPAGLGIDPTYTVAWAKHSLRDGNHGF